ncbi:unnamed protein product [Oppiella nova]|uniref:Peptidase S1 domain-containing protein n=1 Tax=Oppiella nova TaxID=334625 RepID=A0A7R9L9Z8_9ACAR|nr:unnamed protein product [Oppiella nova]CAG2158278.1 unnamed protein product [Oppiella nova]
MVDISVVLGVDEQRAEQEFKESVTIGDVYTTFSNTGITSLYLTNDSSKEDKRKMATQMYDNMRSILINKFDAFDWMDDETRSNSIIKINFINHFIGYKNELLNENIIDNIYESLGDLESDNLFENLLRLQRNDVNNEYNRLNTINNRSDWQNIVTNTVVNAYYSPYINSIKIPIWILEGIFFGTKRPNYLNYGALGWIIGHELIHPFDNIGGKFDKRGNLRDWWDVEVKETFYQKAQSTLSEDIADNGDSDSVKVVSETDNKAKVSTNSTDSRVFRDTQLQRCVTREGRPGYCKAGVCLNLIDKKPVYCPSSSSYYMKCCPINNRAAVLPSNEPICGLRPNNNFFIVGGAEAPAHSWPWAVAIYQNSYKTKKLKSRFICGGTIIAEWYVLSAAHCIVRQNEILTASNFKILIGAHDNKNSGFYADVQEIKIHENFIFGQHRNDIALFKLTQPLDFRHNKDIAPVCLPPPEIEGADLIGTMGTLVGWGTTSQGGKPSPVLQEVEVPISELEDCAKRYSSLLTVSDQINENQLCASYPSGGKDSCQGDSGGSLTVSYSGRYYQLGVVSFGKGCAQPGFPGVYTKGITASDIIISSFLYWIGAHIED